MPRTRNISSGGGLISIRGTSLSFWKANNELIIHPLRLAHARTVRDERPWIFLRGERRGEKISSLGSWRVSVMVSRLEDQSKIIHNIDSGAGDKSERTNRVQGVAAAAC